MRAVIFVPTCCRRARYMADEMRLGVRERAIVDRWMCPELDDRQVLEEVAGCRVVAAEHGLYGYLIIVEGCRSWEDVEEVVYRGGGAVLYV